MNKRRRDKLKLDELRRRAEEKLGSVNDDLSENSENELRVALHELHIYQIELELQNEELRRIQQELVETRDMYVDLYDFAPVGYLTLSDKNLIVEANLTAADLLDEGRKLLHGQPFSRFIFSEGQDIFYKCFRKLITTADPLSCDLRMRKKSGLWFWAKMECVSKPKDNTNGLRIRIAVHDNTEAKDLETEIVKGKKLESTALFAGGIAHDFNNLLAVILGNIQITQENLLRGLPITEKLQDARDACLSAAELTKKFLTFASGGEPCIEFTPTEALVSDSVSLALAGSNVNFKYFFLKGLWPVEVDASQMSLAIGNVITNSREAMLQGGMIRIHAENIDTTNEKSWKFLGTQAVKYVKILIQDQGVGISRDILSQVFDPYFTTKNFENEKGLGMGLTVAYSIIKKHGGAIHIASQLGTGTTVTMYLHASNRQIVIGEPEVQKAAKVSQKVLVMDDEEMLRIVTRALLENLGYEVEVACNGEEAIQLYSSAKKAGPPFGAVILDLTIKGGMGGRETVKRLRKIDPNLKAIVTSGYSSDPVLANYKQYGFFDVLHKPYQLKDIEKSLGGGLVNAM